MGIADPCKRNRLWQSRALGPFQESDLAVKLWLATDWTLGEAGLPTLGHRKDAIIWPHTIGGGPAWADGVCLIAKTFAPTSC